VVARQNTASTAGRNITGVTRTERIAPFGRRLLVFDSIHLLRKVIDHTLRLLPDDPVAAKRLDDIHDVEDGLDGEADESAAAAAPTPDSLEPASGVRMTRKPSRGSVRRAS
jgi:hypothetical protein